MDLKLLGKHRAAVGAAAVGAIVLLVGGTVLATRANGSQTGYQYVQVERTDLSAEVHLDGVVTPATQVDLAFESSGAVASVAVKANDAVKAGQVLATLRASDQSAAYAQAQAGVQAAQAQVAVAQAALDAQQALLNQTMKGSTPEQITAAQTAVTSAQTGVDNANAALTASANAADAALASSTSGAVTGAQSAANDARNTLLTLTDIQYAYDHGSDQDALTVEAAKGAAIESLFGVSDAGAWNRLSVSGLNGGLYAQILSLNSDADASSVETDLTNLAEALRAVNAALGSVPVTDAFTGTDLTTLNGAVALTNGDLQIVAGDLTSMKTQETTNATSATTAAAGVSTAQSALKAAQDQLAIVNAGSRPEAIDAQNANVQSAQANLAAANARVAQAQAAVYAAGSSLGKTVLRSPIDGIVTHVDAKVGQYASASVPVVSLMSSGKEQIEAWAAQNDVPDLAVGQSAKFTLDAIAGETFEATVASVETAPTTVNGTASYKVTLVLTDADDRVKSGMNANVSIGSATHADVLAVPESALIKHGGGVYVIVNDNGPIQREVETGLVASDGRVEITRGVEEGDQVAQFGTAN